MPFITMKLKKFLFLLLQISIIAGFTASCKKKSTKRSTASAPTDINTFGDGDSCAANLSLVEPLSSAKPEDVKIVSAKVEENQVGDHKSAKISFKLADGSAEPNTIYYYVCSEKNPSICSFGDTAVNDDFRSALPAGKNKLYAIPVISEDRLPAPLKNSIKKYEGRLVNKNRSPLESYIAGSGIRYYLGNPISTYFHQNPNTGLERFTLKHSRVDELTNKATKAAYELHAIVKAHFSDKSNDASPEAAIANTSRELFAAAALALYEDAKVATQFGLKKVKEGSSGLNLTQDDPTCVPELSDEDYDKLQNIPTNTDSSFPSTSGPLISIDDDDVEVEDLEQAPVVDEFAIAKANCASEDKRARDLGLGTVKWNDKQNECYYTSNSGGEPSLIVVSNVEEDEVDYDEEEEEDSGDTEGKNATTNIAQRDAGTAFMVIGGLISVGAFVGGVNNSRQVVADAANAKKAANDQARTTRDRLKEVLGDAEFDEVNRLTEAKAKLEAEKITLNQKITSLNKSYKRDTGGSKLKNKPASTTTHLKGRNTLLKNLSIAINDKKTVDIEKITADLKELNKNYIMNKAAASSTTAASTSTPPKTNDELIDDLNKQIDGLVADQKKIIANTDLIANIDRHNNLIAIEVDDPSKLKAGEADELKKLKAQFNDPDDSFLKKSKHTILGEGSYNKKRNSSFAGIAGGIVLASGILLNTLALSGDQITNDPAYLKASKKLMRILEDRNEAMLSSSLDVFKEE